ncbi:AmiS/UreI family transporter [Fervidicoccus fontis]|nr:AmiS/UreI family transporter [Fervidicoccus fontis]
MQWVESLVGMILYLFGANFFVLGMSLMSNKPDLKSSGVFCEAAAIFNVVAALYAATALNLGTTATFALTFGVIWVALGIILIKGYGLTPVGDYSLYAAIGMIWFLYAFIALVHNYLFAYATTLYIITFIAIFLMTRGKVSLKALGWLLIVFGIIGVLVPALMLFMGLA